MKLLVQVPEKDKFNSWHKLNGFTVEVTDHPEKPNHYLVPQTPHNLNIVPSLKAHWDVKDYWYRKGKLSIPKVFVRPANNREMVESILSR